MQNSLHYRNILDSIEAYSTDLQLHASVIMLRYPVHY